VGLLKDPTQTQAHHPWENRKQKTWNTQMQTGLYKEAVIGIKMMVVHRCHPDVKLDQTEVEMIQAKLLIAVDMYPSEEMPPQFLYYKFAQGIFWITCANESSKVWLMRIINGLGQLWEGADLPVVDSKET